jgi:hypothetical protein
MSNYNISLNKDELSLILESLLYSSTVDIIGNFDISYSKKFFDIAKKIRSEHTNVLVENLEIVKNNELDFEDEHTKEIIKLFPDINIQIIE